jgi:hypothetical protein
MEIISRSYNGIEVLFDNTNSLYINATKIAQHFNKQVSKWTSNKDTQAYIEAFSRKENFPFGDLVVVRKGGNDKKAQGTWIHKKLIIAFARWLSPDFAVWCDEQIEDILIGSVQEETETDKNLKGLKTAIEILKLNEASKILMVSTLYKKLGLETSYLPKYSDENHTYSLSALLKKFKVGVSAKKLNQILISNGILEIKTRKSTKKELNENGEEIEKIRTFKSLTEKGLEFGKNLISPHNQLETQPHYFENKFQKLINELEI